MQSTSALFFLMVRCASMTLLKVSSFALSLALLVFAGASSARADDASAPDAFAESLMQERDYYRAITEYKRLAFQSTAASERAHFQLRITDAYRLSMRYQHAIFNASQLVADPDITNAVRASALLELGVSYLGQDMPGYALMYLKQARQRELEAYAQLYEALAWSELGKWSKAHYSAHRALRAATVDTKPIASDLVRAVDHHDDMPSRSPLLAGIFSGVVPGLGQAYSGHYVDAIQALSLVGAFAFMTFVAYQHDHDHDGPYVLTGVSAGITTLFYITNIVGAVRTASYYNQRAQFDWMGTVKNNALNLTF